MTETDETTPTVAKKPRRPKGSGGLRNRGTDRHPRWFAYYEVVIDGKERQLSKGPFSRKGDAEDWLKEELQRVRDGRPTLPSKITVAELLDEWLAARKPGLEPSTFREYERIARHRIAPIIGHHRVKDLRPPHVAHMFDRLRQPGANRRGRQRDVGLSETSIQHTHVVLRTAVEYAVRQRLLTYNLMQDVDRPKRETKRMRVWSADELGAFLAHAAGDRLFPLLRLASHSGARRSEILGLRWTDVDLEASTMSIAGRRTRVGYTMVDRAGTKTLAGTRVVDLDAATITALTDWRAAQDAERTAWGVAYAASGYVFTAEDGEPVHADHLAQRFERLTVGAKVPAIRFHDLRHTHATLLLKAGVPPHVVAQRLGHSSPAFTLSKYSHVLPRQQAAAAAAFAALVDPADRGTSLLEAAPCPSCNAESLGWTTTVEGDATVLSAEGGWLATGFDDAAAAAELVLTCLECGWSETIPTGGWEAR